MIPQTARALESLAHVTLATTLVALTALPAGASSLHSTRSAGLSYTDLAAEALSGTRFEGASPATFEVEAFLTEEFIRADLGLFDLHVRATSLEDKDDAEDWLGVAGALLTTQQRFLEWIEAGASSPDSYDDAFDDLQTLQKWSRKWKAKTLTRQATEGGIDLLDLFSAPEDVRAASERLATFMRTGGPLGLERSPRSEPIVLTPDRRDFVTMICWAGWMQPSLQSIFWQPAVSTWTHFYVNDIKVLAMEYAAPGTRAGELGGGLSMNDHTKDGLEQQIVQLSFGSLVDSYFGERIPPSIAGSIGVNMVIDLYGECDTRVDGDLRERRTEALEIFIPGGNPDGGVLPENSADSRWRKDGGEDFFVGVLRESQKAGASRTRSRDKMSNFELMNDSQTSRTAIRGPFLGSSARGEQPMSSYVGDNLEFMRAYGACFMHWLQTRGGKSKKDSPDRFAALLHGLAHLESVEEVELLIAETYSGQSLSARELDTKTLEGRFLKWLSRHR